MDEVYEEEDYKCLPLLGEHPNLLWDPTLLLWSRGRRGRTAGDVGLSQKGPDYAELMGLAGAELSSECEGKPWSI